MHTVEARMRAGSTAVNGFCRIQSQECGHSGNPPCTRDRVSPFCYSGVYNAAAGICEDCGDYYQPCCRDTAYVCDYGTCKNGICSPDIAAGGAAGGEGALIPELSQAPSVNETYQIK